MLSYLENTSIALWVSESYYAYPALLACHIIGLAIVVGLFSMRDLKLIGLIPDLNLQVFLDLRKLALAGFAINAISGLLLFSSQASYLATNTPFLSKIGCIALGMTLAKLLQSRIKTLLISSSAVIAVDNTTRSMAAASLAVWTGAIIAGRLIAYLF